MNINKISTVSAGQLIQPVENIFSKMVYEAKLGNLTSTANELCAKYPDRTSVIRKFAKGINEINVYALEHATKKVSDKTKFSALA